MSMFLWYWITLTWFRLLPLYFSPSKKTHTIYVSGTTGLDGSIFKRKWQWKDLHSPNHQLSQSNSLLVSLSWAKSYVSTTCSDTQHHSTVDFLKLQWIKLLQLRSPWTGERTNTPWGHLRLNQHYKYQYTSDDKFLLHICFSHRHWSTCRVMVSTAAEIL